jgi:hypothetical protein
VCATAGLTAPFSLPAQHAAAALTERVVYAAAVIGYAIGCFVTESFFTTVLIVLGATAVMLAVYGPNWGQARRNYKAKRILKVGEDDNGATSEGADATTNDEATTKPNEWVDDRAVRAYYEALAVEEAALEPRRAPTQRY